MSKSILLIATLCLLVNNPSWANAPGDGPKGVEILPDMAEGLPIALLYVHLEASTGDLTRDEELRKQVAEAFSIRPGDLFRPLIVEMGLKRVRRLPSVQAAQYRVYEAVPSGQTVVVIFITPLPVETEVSKKPSGMLISRQIRDFPTFFENDRSKFVFILNGGAGIYTDSNPWFGGYGKTFNRGSPIADDPAGPGSTTWVEGYVEPGIGGIFQIGNYPLYPYGAVTYLMSGTYGHDIYNSGTWGHGEFERLYGGFIYDLPGKGNVFDFSVFTGDDPDTRQFERFDPLFSGGQGNFVPGIVFSKVYKNSNLHTHRATFNLKPTDTLEFILDYYHHRADVLNNLGGIGPLQVLKSKDIGQEVMFTTSLFIGKHIFWQGLASVGIPGDAIKKAVEGNTKNWFTFQSSLYFFF